MFIAKNTSEYVTFYWLSTSGFKTEASFNEKASIWSGEKMFETLYNSIIRNYEFPMVYRNRILILKKLLGLK